MCRLSLKRPKSRAQPGCYSVWTASNDPTATPKIWDHRSNESRKKGGDALGIYEIDSDKLKVACVAGTSKDKRWTGEPRPTEFKLEAADVVLELRRVKSEK